MSTSDCGPSVHTGDRWNHIDNLDEFFERVSLYVPHTTTVYSYYSWQYVYIVKCYRYTSIIKTMDCGLLLSQTSWNYCEYMYILVYTVLEHVKYALVINV